MAEPLYRLPAGDILQGDIYDLAPSVLVRSRPIRAARQWKVDKGGREIWAAHVEGGAPPQDGFKWAMDRGGEIAVLVHGYLDRAMVLSHDCEIENDQNARILAMVRPASHLAEPHRSALFDGKVDQVQYAIFPLEAQDADPRVERSFVDFRRLTTVRPEVLDASVRVASVSEELRRAVARAFWMYLFRRVEEGAD